MSQSVWAVYPKFREDTSRRNCFQMQKILGIPFVDSYESLVETRVRTGVDWPEVVFTGHLIYLCFCDWVKEFTQVMKHAKRIIFFRDEYQKYVEKAMRDYNKGDSEVWSSIRYLVDDKRVFYMNWNQSAYDPTFQREWNPQREGLFYYGTLRDDRYSSARRYMQSNRYPIHIAASRNDLLGWRKLNPKINMVLYNQTQAFNIFQATVYIEDDWMWSHDCSISCRFYEALRSGLPIFFDYKTIPGFERAGIEIPDEWVVESDRDVARLLPKSATIQGHQRNWFKKYDWYADFDWALRCLAAERGIYESPTAKPKVSRQRTPRTRR